MAKPKSKQEEEEEEGNDGGLITTELFVIILISSVLGGFMSLYIYIIYQSDNSILNNPQLPHLFSLIFVSFGYLVYIALAVLIIWAIIKFLTFYFNILLEPIQIVSNWFMKQFKKLLIWLGFKSKINNNFKEFNSEKLYKEYPQEINLLSIIFANSYIIYEFDSIIAFLGTKKIIIIFITLTILGVFNIFMYIKRLRNKQ